MLFVGMDWEKNFFIFFIRKFCIRSSVKFCIKCIEKVGKWVKLYKMYKKSIVEFVQKYVREVCVKCTIYFKIQWNCKQI